MINPLYSLLLVISGFVSLFVAGVAWSRRPNAGAAPLAITMLMMVLWSWTYAMAWLLPGERDKFFWIGLAFIGVVVSSPAFLVMALEFTGNQHRLTKKFYIFIFAIPVVASIFYWTDPWFGLFFGGASISDQNDLLRGGLGLTIVGLNGYFCTFWSVGLLLRNLRTASRIKYFSILIILIGTSFPFLATIAGLLHLTPFPGLDLTPIVFAISGIFYAYGLFTYRMMDLAPIGREAVLENMSDCMLVVDDLGRVVDLNSRAGYFVDGGVEYPVGKYASSVFSKWFKELHLDLNMQEGNFHKQLEGPDFFHYDISITLLKDAHGDMAGKLLVWRDVSAQKKAEIELHELNLRLQNQLTEIEKLHGQLRDQAIHDSLTGLFNRRYMEEILQKEMAQALRANSPLSVVMMDVDRFKQINDRCGHQAGDLILQALGQMLLKNIREGDIACRYGGDELVVVMPDAVEVDAAARANLWREDFAKISFFVEDNEVSTTLSFGIASLAHGFKRFADLLIAADKALYISKVRRNAVTIFNSSDELANK